MINWRKFGGYQCGAYNVNGRYHGWDTRIIKTGDLPWGEPWGGVGEALKAWGLSASYARSLISYPSPSQNPVSAIRSGWHWASKIKRMGSRRNEALETRFDQTAKSRPPFTGPSPAENPNWTSLLWLMGQPQAILSRSAAASCQWPPLSVLLKMNWQGKNEQS